MKVRQKKSLAEAKLTVIQAESSNSSQREALEREEHTPTASTVLEAEVDHNIDRLQTRI